MKGDHYYGMILHKADLSIYLVDLDLFIMWTNIIKPFKETSS